MVENGAKVMDQSSSDALVSSSSEMDASNEVNIGADLLESETGTLTIERSSTHYGGGDIVVNQDAVDDVRVYGDEKGTLIENVEKVVDESSSDAVVSSAPPSNSEIAAGNGINIGAGLLEVKSQTLMMELSSNHDDVGKIVDHQDSVDDVGVSGDEQGNVMEDVKEVLDESRSDAVYRVNIGAGLLEIKIQTMMMESSSNHDGGGEIVVHQDVVDDAGVSGDERGNAMEDVEKVLDESRSNVAVLSVATSNIDIAASNGVKTEAGLFESQTGSLMMEPASDHDGPGDIVFHQDSIDDAGVSGDEKEFVMEDAEKVLKESSSDAVAFYQDSIDDARVDEKECVMEDAEKVLKESSSDAVVFHQDSIDDARVSGDEKETVMEDAEKVLKDSSSDVAVSSVTLSNSDIAASNGVNTKDDLLESKNETLSVEPPCSHGSGGGDIVVQDSIHNTRVLGDEKRIVMENFENVPDDNGVIVEEKEGEYKVTDLVWAKVRCYPWWPGQIFDPSASTDNAKKYSNKKGFLVGYFGDQTFAWNEASKIKPFRKNFGKMEKQSNSKGFVHAVNCALDEVLRRVEFGLACPCLSKEVYAKIKSQVFVSAGIREEASKIDGGDRFSTVATFKPANIVHSVQDLAREHFDGFNRLEALSLRAQLLTYNCWKGYNQFQAQNLLDVFSDKVEDISELPLMEEEKVVEEAKPASVGEKVSSKKRKLNSCDSGSRKLEHMCNNDSVPSKKENRLTNMSPKGSMSETVGENKKKKFGGKKATVEPNGFKEESGNVTADQKSSISPPKKLFRIGDTICKIAKQITESPSIPKKESQSHISKDNEKYVDQTKESKHGPEANPCPKSKTSKKNLGTALILKFTNLDSIPSVTKLNEIFSRYGSVRETETELLKKKNCAKVVFEEQSNAEKAFSSAGKFNIFGPSLVSYRLDYSPTSRKTP